MFEALVFDRFTKDAVATILQMIARCRAGEPQDITLLGRGIEFFVDCGRVTEQGMALYEKELEQPLLKESVAFFNRQASSWLTQDSCADYMFKAERTIEAEKTRLRQYLHSRTATPLLKSVIHGLVVVPFDALLVLRSGVDHLFEARSTTGACSESDGCVQSICSNDCVGLLMHLLFD